ncbi:unnamed protein product [Hermetia illucens]|uniref:C2H2-type domain-containing protein n=1 Tax=Hermetia illucens TaxID=343691 RepID=A0A7R8USN1_HERIL|nr:zinc finger protein 236-like [Hermetia illucens]CAD7085870.1 unnamed protein product [Hermetia illucens]
MDPGPHTLYSVSDSQTMIIPLDETNLSIFGTPVTDSSSFDRFINDSSAASSVNPAIDGTTARLHSPPSPPGSAPSTKATLKYKKCRKKHIQSSTASANRLPRTYNCDLCTEKFHLPSLRRLHRETAHSLPKPFKCEKCPKRFNSEENCRIHVASHLEAPAACPECGACFQRSTRYRSHLKTHMRNEDLYCEECNQNFENENVFWRHIDMKHSHSTMGVEYDDLTGGIMRKGNVGSSAMGEEIGRFQCNICEKSFTRSSNLTRHLLIHTKTKHYQCTKCSMNFTQKSTLRRHYLIHSGAKEFKCPKCSARFSQRGNLEIHMQRVHPSNPDLTNKFPCPDCSCVFNKLNSLNRHSAKMHSTKLSTIHENNDEDSECNFDQIMAKLRTIAMPDTTSDNCSLFPNGKVSSPVIGSVGMIGDDVLTASDADCGYVKIVETLNSAKEKSEVVVKQVEGEDGRKYYCCDICSKRFQRPHDLLKHSRVHTNEKPYECGICGRCFAINSNLQVHLRIHGKDSERITNCFQCPKCFVQFSSLRQLDIHAKIHKDSKLFPCKICNKHFSSSSNLRIHEYTHRPKDPAELEARKNLKGPMLLTESMGLESPAEEYRRFQCSICGLKFKRPDHLMQHEGSHAGAKPHQCSVCLKQFTTLSSLRRHQEIHTGQKTKQCDMCDAKFHSNTELKRHQSVHSSARPYLCPYCQKSFKTRERCRVHIKTHAKDLKVNEENPNCAEESMHDYVNHTSDANGATELDTNFIETDNSVYLNLDDSLIQSNAVEDVVEDVPSFTAHAERVNSSKFIDIKELIRKKSTKALANTITVHSIEEFPPPIDPPQSTSDNSSVRKNPCEKCGRSFQKPIDLRRHLRTHTQERPFECNVCHAFFKLKCTLDTHKRVHEENRAKFDCQVCGKSYSSADVLKVHIRVHTNERPYKCKYCDKTFRTTGHNKVHMRTHLKSAQNLANVQRREEGR